MYSSNSIFKKAIDVAKGVMLLGTAIFGWGSMANAAEVSKSAEKAGSMIAKVETVKVGHNLKTVVEALAIIDPAWVERQPKVDRQASTALPAVMNFQTNYYYQYIGADHSNAAIRNPNNWVFLGTNPALIPCDGEDVIMCAARLPVEEDELEDYVENLTFTQLNTAGRVETYREEQ